MNALVSCLCVTRNRPLQLERAMACFESQTYSQRELVVVYESDDQATRDFLNLKKSQSMRLIEVDSTLGLNLGDLRNLAVQKAAGELVMQWDDDDWYHIHRIEHQVKALIKAGTLGCVLQNWVVLDLVDSHAYLSHARLWEGSLLCQRKVLLERGYDSQSRGEDSALIFDLYNRNGLTVIKNAPHLYLYVFNGNNTWDQDHWNDIFKASMKFHPTVSERIKDIHQGTHSDEENSRWLNQLFKIPWGVF